MNKNINDSLDDMEKLKHVIKNTINKVYESKIEKLGLDIDFGKFNASFL